MVQMLQIESEKLQMKSIERTQLLLTPELEEAWILFATI
jgi:hypothetical protein